jgi:peptide/nickel transport system ATP-binding protein
MMLPLLRINGLSIDFQTEGRVTHAVQEVSLEIRRGELLALVGESGSGKSVTSMALLGLLPRPPAVYREGELLFSPDGVHSVDLLKLTPDELQAVRGGQIAMVFQEPMTSLNPVMTCGRQVAETLRIHKKLSEREVRQEAIEWFEKVRLPQPSLLYDRYPHQLSGGQKQRVMLAMAMCCRPSLLICDEPTTALDVTVQKRILELIRELQLEGDMGILFITHDLGVVKEIADRVAILYKGRIVEQGIAESIFAAPAHPYTKALIACRPALHPRGERLPVVSDFLQPETAQPRVRSGANEEPKETEELVTVRDLTIRFPGPSRLFGKPKQHFTAVDGVSFEIYKGETLGLVGESGCGKTTLGRALLGLVPPSSGSIRYGEQDLTGAGKEQWKALRKEVQLVFQDPYSSLNPRLTIGAALTEPMKVAGLLPDSRQRRNRAAELLERVNLSPQLMNRYPHEFSGGQRQRIVIARALALEPDFLVCDESVAALDVSVQAQVLNLLNELKADLRLTLLFISHDLSVVRYMSDRMLVMQKGKIVESGSAEAIYRAPANAYTRELLAAIPGI